VTWWSLYSNNIIGYIISHYPGALVG